MCRLLRGKGLDMRTVVPFILRSPPVAAFARTRGWESKDLCRPIAARREPSDSVSSITRHHRARPLPLFVATFARTWGLLDFRPPSGERSYEGPSPELRLPHRVHLFARGLSRTVPTFSKIPATGRLVKLADTQDLGSCAARRRGSTPRAAISLALIHAQVHGATRITKDRSGD